MALLSRNVGRLDKWVRLILGALAIAWGAYSQRWWLLAIGIVVFLTGVLSRCGLYYLLGVSTCPVEKKS